MKISKLTLFDDFLRYPKLFSLKISKTPKFLENRTEKHFKKSSNSVNLFIFTMLTIKFMVSIVKIKKILKLKESL